MIRAMISRFLNDALPPHLPCKLWIALDSPKAGAVVRSGRFRAPTPVRGRDVTQRGVIQGVQE